MSKEEKFEGVKGRGTGKYEYETIIDLNINGMIRTIEVANNWTLLKVLRDKLNLTGTKCGCERGECGACTVLINGKPVLSCLTLAVEAHMKEITTIEGLAAGGVLHPLQESFIKNHAFQCGFCTPGVLLTTKALLDENPNPTEDEIKHFLTGNLCRCGAYPKIVKAIRDVAKRRWGENK